MSLSNKGVERLLEVAEVIKHDPAGFDMSTWLEKGENRPTHCNTVGCIAGWLVALNRPAAVKIAKEIGEYRADAGPRIENKITDIPRVAEKLLGDDGSLYTSELFFADEWPHQYYWRFDRARTGRAKVAAAVARIKAYIKEHKPASK